MMHHQGGPVKSFSELQRSVVKLRVDHLLPDPFKPFEVKDSYTSVSSAFFFKPDHLLTCYHCVHGAVACVVSFASFEKTQYEAEVLCCLPHVDLAVVRLREPCPHQRPLQFHLSEVQEMQPVLAVGYPLESDSLKFTEGIVSGRMEEFVQTDAPINEGNSGGPLLDKDTLRVVGVNSQKLSNAENVGLTVPAALFCGWGDAVFRSRVIRPLQLSVKTCKTNAPLIRFLKKFKKFPRDSGVLVTRSCSPLISANSVVYEVNGLPVDNHGYVGGKVSLHTYVKTRTGADTLTFSCFDLHKEEDYKAVLSPLQAQGKQTSGRHKWSPVDDIECVVVEGLVIMELNQSHQDELPTNDQVPFFQKVNLFKHFSESLCDRVFVSAVLLASPARFLDIIRPGDVLESINGIPVKTLADVKEALKSHLAGFIVLKTDMGVVYTTEVNPKPSPAVLQQHQHARLHERVQGPLHLADQHLVR